MANRARYTGWRVAALAASLLAAAGCESGQQVATVADQLLQAGSGTAPRTPMHNVVPSRSPVEQHVITIVDERYLGDVARQLGVTVDSLQHDNGLTSNQLQPGQQLLVTTSRELVKAFEQAGNERRERKAAAERAKLEAKRKAEAEAKAARLAAKRAAKLAKSRKGKAELAAVGKPADKSAGKKPR